MPSIVPAGNPLVSNTAATPRLGEMESLRTTTSQSERAVRAKLEKRFATIHAFKNNCRIPSRDEIEKHVNYEIHLSKIFTLSPGFEQDVWDMVYDDGVKGASGADKQCLEELCNDWEIPEANIACRNKVKVLEMRRANTR
jgi:hypothetical protein